MKKFITLFLIIISIYSFSITGSANEPINISQDEISYDLTLQKSQTFVLAEDNDKIYLIAIEPLSFTNRINNGKYKITFSNPNAWEANFIITLSSNKIINISSPVVRPLKGSVKNILPQINTPYQASLKFIYSYLGISDSTGVRVSISNNKLITKKI